MRKQTYDTLVGIAASLTDYASFYALAKAREKSPNATRGRLSEFVILGGKLLLNQYGGVMRSLDDKTLPPITAEIVITRRSYVAARESQDRELNYHWYRLTLPPPHTACTLCGKAESGLEHLNECILNQFDDFALDDKM